MMHTYILTYNKCMNDKEVENKRAREEKLDHREKERKK